MKHSRTDNTESFLILVRITPQLSISLYLFNSDLGFESFFPISLYIKMSSMSLGSDHTNILSPTQLSEQNIARNNSGVLTQSKKRQIQRPPDLLI